MRWESRGDGKFLRGDYQEAERAVHEYGDPPIKGEKVPSVVDVEGDAEKESD